MCNNGSMEWSGVLWMVEEHALDGGAEEYGVVCCLVVERKNMPLNGGRTCNGWWKYGLIWGFQLWMGQEYAVEWWKNMQWMMDVWSGVIWGLSVVDVGRICCCLVEEHAMDGGSALGCLRNMLLVVEEDAHSGCKFAMILKKRQKMCAKNFTQLRSFLFSFFSFFHSPLF
uniref:Uncharacterized protein n=1 Tax=Meloidogyne enterolobii TaxID=390850 RepID=A0A6V7XY68_MELEN|nr:unnamed protein product [Meloidogyne enterolobii]